MIEHRCRNCMWFDMTHPRLVDMPAIPGIPNPGICRKHKPGAYMSGPYYIGVQPIMDADDFCGEFREDKEGS